MSDLFGARVPDERVEDVFETVRSCPRHTFQFLTRNPGRYATLDLPSNAWHGTTVDRVEAVGRIGALRLPGWTMFASFEPLVIEIDPELVASTHSSSARAHSPCDCRGGSGSNGSWREPAGPALRSS